MRCWVRGAEEELSYQLLLRSRIRADISWPPEGLLPLPFLRLRHGGTDRFRGALLPTRDSRRASHLTSLQPPGREILPLPEQMKKVQDISSTKTRQMLNRRKVLGLDLLRFFCSVVACCLLSVEDKSAASLGSRAHLFKSISPIAGSGTGKS